MKLNNRKLLILIIFAIDIILFIIVMLMLTGFINFDNYKDKRKDDVNDNIKNIIIKDTNDYSSYVGTYVSFKNKDESYVKKNGGIILNIIGLGDNQVKFNIASISSNNRIAVLDSNSGSKINIDKNEKGKFYFDWEQDGFNSKGTGIIDVSGKDVKLTIKSDISDDNKSGWNLGNFDNKIMYKIK